MSVKFQRSPIADRTQRRHACVSNAHRVLSGRTILGRRLCTTLVVVCFVGSFSIFRIAVATSATEIPRQQNQTELQEIDVKKLAAIQECPVGAAQPKVDPANIEKLLSDLDPSSKRAIAAVPSLINALRSPETPSLQRERVGTMLGRIGEPARGAVPILIGYLGESKSKTDSQSTGPAITSKDDDARYWAMKCLCLFGPVAADAVPAVRTILISREVSHRLRLLAADTLGQLRSPAAIGVLTRQLLQPRRNSSYKETLLRQTLIDSLALAGPQAVGALPALSRATEDSSANIRRSACQTIGAMGPRADGALIPLLERLVLDDDAAVKDAAADALARVGPVAIPNLTELLERGGPDLQWRAAKSLGQMGRRAKDAIPQLTRALQSPDDGVRIEAADALLQVSRDATLVSVTLVKELSTDDRQVRRRAAQILISIDSLSTETLKELHTLAAAGSATDNSAAAYVLRERSRKPDQ